MQHDVADVALLVSWPRFTSSQRLQSTVVFVDYNKENPPFLHFGRTCQHWSLVFCFLSSQRGRFRGHHGSSLLDPRSTRKSLLASMLKDVSSYMSSEDGGSRRCSRRQQTVLHRSLWLRRHASLLGACCWLDQIWADLEHHYESSLVLFFTWVQWQQN